jgi:hypothetical protein
MVKMTGPENIGSVKVGDQAFTPDENGCLYVPDDLSVEVLDVLRSHGFSLIGWQANSGQLPVNSEQKKAKP